MWVVALKSGDEGYTEASGEKRIFAVGFLPASPTGIAENIYVGRPEGETVVAAEIVVGNGVVVFGASFGGDDVGDRVDEVGVPGGSEADGLGKNSGDAGTGNAVKSFVPPVVGGDLEARDGGSDVLHLCDFFFDGHPRDEIGDALIDGEGGIEIDGRRGWRLCLGEREGWDQEKTKENQFWSMHGCWSDCGARRWDSSIKICG